MYLTDIIATEYRDLIAADLLEVVENSRGDKKVVVTRKGLDFINDLIIKDKKADLDAEATRILSERAAAAK